MPTSRVAAFGPPPSARTTAKLLKHNKRISAASPGASRFKPGTTTRRKNTQGGPPPGRGDHGEAAEPQQKNQRGQPGRLTFQDGNIDQPENPRGRHSKLRRQ